MAADGEANKDFRAHEGTYALFIGMMKWGTIVAALIGAMVVWIIHA